MESMKFIQAKNEGIYNCLVNFLDQNELAELDHIIESYADSDKSGSEIDFEIFWEHWHTITGVRKTDKEAAIKKWKQLKKKEKAKAYELVEPWFKSLKNPNFCPKCRTYLGNKNFNDELKDTRNEENRRSYQGRIHQK